MEKPPFTHQQVFRFLVALVVILAIIAGYYYTVYGYEVRKTTRLEKQIIQLQQGETK